MENHRSWADRNLSRLIIHSFIRTCCLPFLFFWLACLCFTMATKKITFLLQQLQGGPNSILESILLKETYKNSLYKQKPEKTNHHKNESSTTSVSSFFRYMTIIAVAKRRYDHYLYAFPQRKCCLTPNAFWGMTGEKGRGRRYTFLIYWTSWAEGDATSPVPYPNLITPNCKTSAHSCSDSGISFVLKVDASWSHSISKMASHFL